MATTIGASRFGVQLVNPVDQYHMASRSVKYAFLFIMLTFATLWLIEVLAGVRVHPIQYLMLGGALCLFYLLELALSEHVGFPVAYSLASIAVIGMVGGYSFAILRRAKAAAVVARMMRAMRPVSAPKRSASSDTLLALGSAATSTITDSANNSPQTVPLTGFGK